MIVLIPISCWKTASPIATISAGRTHGSLRTRAAAVLLLLVDLADLLDLCVDASSSSVELARAPRGPRPPRPRATRKRGVSGMGIIPTSRIERGHDGQAEHQRHSPGGGQDRVDDERDEDAHHDHELVQRADRPAVLGRRDLGEVERHHSAAQPTARPSTKRAAISAPAPGATRGAEAPTVKVTAAIMISRLRPRLSDERPGQAARRPSRRAAATPRPRPAGTA